MTLLLVAGDRDGWQHLDAVARALPDGGAGCLALCGAGLPPVARAPTIAVADGEAEEVVARELAGRGFDAALVATSRLGPDALTVAVARRSAGAPLSVIQEFWGDTLGVGPADGSALRYFVRDALAARLTEARAPEAAVRVAGSPKYAAFERHDIEAARRERREALGLREGQALAGWFGQAPLAEGGYRRTLAAFAAAVAARAGTKVAYRPHPREPEAQARRSVAAIREAGADAHLATAGDTWQWLAAADAVFACFSNCCADAVHLGRASARPLNASAYLLFDAELRRHHEGATAMAEPPLATLGLVLQATQASRIADTIDEALDPRAVERQWDRARRMLPLGSAAAASVVRELGRTASAPRTATADRERT